MKRNIEGVRTLRKGRGTYRRNTLKKIRNTITIQKIKTFISALYNHVKTGMKKSSQRTINLRWNICQGCEKFGFESWEENGKHIIKHSCNLCGCNLSKQKVFMNKLAWKDQKCPLGKW